MKISILENVSENVEQKKTIIAKFRAAICHLSVWNVFLLLLIMVVFLFVFYACKAYTSNILIWLETQDSLIVYIVIIILFTLMSFPICVGYIGVVIASGYLYGILKGLILSIIGANVGALIAHNVMKLIGHHSFIKSMTRSETALAIIRVISGPSSFKIIFCARLTPIPFGLQNCIFSLTRVSGRVYVVASFLGLLLGQAVGVYAGSSLRSMQDVIDNQQISMFTYFFAALQLILAACMLVWLGSKARVELTRAIAEAEGKLSLVNGKSKTFSTLNV